MGRILTAYRMEVAKAVRSRYTYVGPVLVLAVVLAMQLVRGVARDGQGDYAFISYSTSVSLNLLGLLLILMHASSLISTEVNSGVIRTVLVRPLLRAEYFAAKLMMAWTYAAALTLVVAAASWGLVIVRGDVNGVMFGGEVLYANREMLGTYFTGLAIGLLPLFAACAYALFISCAVTSPAASVVCAVGIWFMMDLIKYPLRIAPVLFSSYMEQPWRVFSERAQGLDAAFWPGCQGTIIASTAWLVVFIAAALFVLQRRNLCR